MSNLIKTLAWLSFVFMLLDARIAFAEDLVLYHTASPPGAYILSRSYAEDEKTQVSEVILAKTFSVKPHGDLVEVKMKDANVFRTKISAGATSNSVANVKQSILTIDELTMNFEKGTRLIYNNNTSPLSRYKGAVKRVGREYQGEAAEQWLKSMGIELSNDGDVKDQ